MTIPEQTVLVEIFYFGQVFVFGRLVNKNVLVETIPHASEQEEVSRCPLLTAFA